MNQFQQWAERFNQLQQREKILIWIGSLALTLWLLFVYLLEPGWRDISKAKQNAQSQQTQLQDSQVLAMQLREQLAVDQDKVYREQLEQLQKQQQLLNAQIQQSANHFIAAEQMVSLLQSVLQQSRNVQLVSLTTSAPLPVRLQGQAEDQPALLFQHELKLVVAGQFNTLLLVLKELEQLPWLVSWTALDYAVTEYPAAQMTIQLGTVSEQKDVIRL